ncbi:MAG TPA: SWIB/MDM2 domain-containing protein [candidate division Zixibacteria bacterium]|nr:SWIB/MDM2 domain-containing protein [candidate division Zixibacteria bacterium]
MPVAKKKAPAKKKAAPKKTTAKKAAPKKTTAKKAAPKKKVTTKKVAPKKTTVKKAAPKKAAPKKKAAAKKPAAKKAAPKKKAAAKKPAAKKAAPKKKTASKRKPNPAFMRPMELSADLGAIVGTKAIPRTEVTKKLWEYIKKNGLQDTANKRMINADEKLKKIFGGKKQVSMFEMTKLVSKHMK